jgi:peptidoglycan-associated lipoprotein
VTDTDCPSGQNCRDGNCIDKPVETNACANLEPVYFDFDESTLRADARNTLSKHADCVNTEKKRLLLEGHCDERGTEEYNLALGERRAKTTRDYIEQLGVKRRMLKTISYGESKPAKFGSSESVYQLNRRCEFKWQ